MILIVKIVLSSLRPRAMLACFGLALTLAASPGYAQKPTLVSIQHGGIGGGGTLSEDPVVSANGRFVAFQSFTFNLVPNDNNGSADIFVRDLQTGTTILASANLAGTATGNGHSTKPVISADGRYVAFESGASNLVANDTNTSLDVFVRDLQTGTTTLLSLNTAGTGSGNQGSSSPRISANGQVVVFQSFASNLVTNDNNNAPDVFARDLQSGVTSLVSSNAAGTFSGNNASYLALVPKDKAPRASISNDGRFVVFESYATDLVPLTDSNGNNPDAFVRDLQTNTTTLVSINRFGTASGNGGGTQPVISGNGRFVFFQSSSTDLTSNGAPFSFNLYVRDLQTGVTEMVSVTTSNAASRGPLNSNYFPVASDDGRYVIFQSDAKDYVVNDSNNGYDIFLRDRQTNTTTLISVNVSGGTGPNSVANGAVMSSDGRYVAFNGFGTDYVTTSDTNGRSDVFLRDVAAGTTTLLSVNNAGTSSAINGGDYPVISADGRFVLFESSSTDMVPNPISGLNIFAVAVGGRVHFDATNLNVNETAGNANFAITRTGNTTGPLTVQYATRNGTAAAGADYTALSGSVTFADGETSKTIVLPILNDNIDEHAETLSLTLSDFNAGGGAAGSLSMALLTIEDDDPPPSISINDIEVVEGNSGSTTANITLSLSNVSGKTISVDLAATAGTATATVDYTFLFNKANVSPGALTQTVSVAIVGETRFEDDETFFVNLSNPVDVTIADTQGMVTIKNDDPVPSFTIADLARVETNGGTTSFIFQVRLSNASSRQITVQLDTANGTAQAGSDYVARSVNLIFPPGATLANVPITVNGDTYIEPNETFFVNLSIPTEASIADPQAAGTILNDDLPVLLTETNSEVGIAVNSVTWVRDPFALTTPFNLSSDTRTRVSLFGLNLDLFPGETSSAVTAVAEDELGNTYSLPVEYVGAMLNPGSISQVMVRLPENVGAAHELRIKISLRGETSNRVLVRITP
jgi:hypothetical protein